VRRVRPTIAFVGLVCLSLGHAALLSGCGGSDSSSTVAVKSADEYAEGARKIAENNRKHVQEALAARKAGRGK
jgi:hypothetical protein